jgi:hypothetical protein
MASPTTITTTEKKRKFTSKITSRKITPMLVPNNDKKIVLTDKREIKKKQRRPMKRK